MISKKNFILICLIVIFSFSICSARDLEIDYPEIGGYQPEEVSTPLPEYVKYIFNFSIWIIGFVAFGFILIGGFRYLTSSGNPTIQSDSKNQIFSALLGIIILISSYLILETINPELKVFTLDPLEKASTELGPGVWLCTENIESFEDQMEDYKGITEEQEEIIKKSCKRVFTKSSFTKNFAEELKHVYIVGEYGVVLHKGSSFMEECEIVTSSKKIDSYYSATPFFLNSSDAGKGVTVYEDRDFGTEGKSYGPVVEGTYLIDFEPAQSIKIDGDKEWVAVAFGKKEGMFSKFGNPDYCEVFNKNDRNLTEDRISKFCSKNWFFRQPCIGELHVFKGTTF